MNKKTIMKALKKLSILGAGALLLASCSTTRPLAITDNSIGDKVGTSKTTCIGSMSPAAGAAGAGSIISSGICFNGKYGVKDAAENGGITTVGAIDIKVTHFLFWSTYELIVAGE